LEFETMHAETMITCPECGQPFAPRDTGASGGKPQKFCSDRCRLLDWRARRKAAGEQVVAEGVLGPADDATLLSEPRTLPDGPTIDGAAADDPADDEIERIVAEAERCRAAPAGKSHPFAALLDDGSALGRTLRKAVADEQREIEAEDAAASRRAVDRQRVDWKRRWSVDPAIAASAPAAVIPIAFGDLGRLQVHGYTAELVDGELQISGHQPARNLLHQGVHATLAAMIGQPYGAWISGAALGAAIKDYQPPWLPGFSDWQREARNLALSPQLRELHAAGWCERSIFGVPSAGGGRSVGGLVCHLRDRKIVAVDADHVAMVDSAGNPSEFDRPADLDGLVPIWAPFEL
jgi:endogenous inhibitor of DNA gyrase (YacG/DUF329 family)